MRENYPPRPQKGMGGHMFVRETDRQRRVKTHLVVTTLHYPTFCPILGTLRLTFCLLVARLDGLHRSR